MSTIRSLHYQWVDTVLALRRRCFWNVRFKCLGFENDVCSASDHTNFPKIHNGSMYVIPNKKQVWGDDRWLATRHGQRLMTKSYNERVGMYLYIPNDEVNKDEEKGESVGCDIYLLGHVYGIVTASTCHFDQFGRPRDPWQPCRNFGFGKTPKWPWQHVFFGT